MTIFFHVDDCKLIPKIPKVMGKAITRTKQEYESIFEDGSGEMTVHQGRVQNYLRMTLNYNEGGNFKVSMIDYIDEIIVAFYKADPRGCGINTSAAPEDLYKVDEDCDNISPDKVHMFHNIVANTLYTTNQARPDTCTAVAFLTKIVREPTKYDWYKLVYLMKYIKGTRDFPLVISANGSGVLKWWIDASYAVNTNIRGHTGVGLSMGRGFPIMTSTKQKLNTRSST